MVDVPGEVSSSNHVLVSLPPPRVKFVAVSGVQALDTCWTSPTSEWLVPPFAMVYLSGASRQNPTGSTCVYRIPGSVVQWAPVDGTSDWQIGIVRLHYGLESTTGRGVEDSTEGAGFSLPTQITGIEYWEDVGIWGESGLQSM